MEKKVRTYVIENHLILPGDRLVLGLSGGADSVCLFFLLLAMREELSFTFTCVHVHHGLRGVQADEDERYAKELCEQHGISFQSFRYRVAELAHKSGCSTEEMGRTVRYQAFEQVLREKGFNKIAVAHHMTDQAETVLYHLCRGSGLTGLSGMKPVSGNRIRPLLCVRKEEITAYLTAHQIPWREDATNGEAAYTRNRIRSRVLPCLKELVNPASVEHIASTAEILSEAENYIRKQAQEQWEHCGSVQEGRVSLTAEYLNGLDIVIRKQILFLALDAIGMGRRNLQAVHIHMLLRLAEGQSGHEICLPGGVRVSRTQKELLFSTQACVQETWEALQVTAGEYELPDGRGILSLSEPVRAEEIPQKEIAKNSQNGYTKWFDYDKIKDTLRLRTRAEGDYLEFSEAGLKKRLKSYMIDEKIPKQERNHVWLLADGSHILWVLGYRISEYYKIRPDTRWAVRAEIKWRK